MTLQAVFYLGADWDIALGDSFVIPDNASSIVSPEMQLPLGGR
jgi:hypothetical protein